MNIATMPDAQISFPDNEDARLSALQSYDLFDTGEEEDFDAITSLASTICQIPVVLITFIDKKRQWFKSHHGTDVTENLRERSFCTHAIASDQEIMIVENPSMDSPFADNLLVTGPAKIGFYAGVPLVNEDGFALGTLCVLDQQTRILSDHQIQALKTLAKQVIDKIELRRKVLNLESANQELLNSNVLIQKFASMAAHDIKNPLSSILLTSQALKKKHEKMQDDGCLRLVNININSANSLLTLVDEMLEYSKNPSLLIARKTKFDLHGLLKRVLALLTIPENFEINLPIEKHELHLSIIAFEQILINLLSNAIRYNDKVTGIINIRFNSNQDYYSLEVEDNGIGIAEQFYDRIFENNFTLKITDRYQKKGSGIGLSTVKDLVNVLGGNIEVKSQIGEGTTFNISIKK